MVGHGGSSAGSYLADPTSPIPSHCASIVVTSTLRVNILYEVGYQHYAMCVCLYIIVPVIRSAPFLAVCLTTVITDPALG